MRLKVAGFAPVDTRVICNWLGLPDTNWPPDHYTLLGLPPGESDVARIESHVQQRLDAVRRYQLTHPEPATEAMNRLAQAFICLTDPVARRAYARKLLGEPLPDTEETSRNTPTPAQVETLVNVSAMLATVKPATAEEEPWEPELLEGPPSPPGPPVESESKVEPRPAPAPLPVPEPPSEPVDPALEAAQSQPARRGLGTKRALYHRLARTRALLRAWNEAGKFLNDPRRRLTRQSEGRELVEKLRGIRRALQNFPPLLGEAGQPGYLVLALARQQVIVATFQTLIRSQREALARDWQTGRRFLLAHRDFLRKEVRALKRQTLLGKLLRIVRVFLADHPSAWLGVLGAAALMLAIVRQFLF